MAEKLLLPLQNKISDVGFAHQFSVSETYPLHYHEFCEFFLVVKGSAIHTVNGENEVINKGSFVFIRANDIHKYEVFNQAEFEIISISISDEALRLSCNLLEIDKSILIEPKKPCHIKLSGVTFTDVTKKLLDIDNKSAGEERKKYFRSILPMLILLFVSEKSEQKDCLIPSWLSIVISAMDKDEFIVAGLPKLYELAGVSHEHLSREFKKYLNLTPTEFINMKRMNLAINYFGDGKDITNTCYLCGYNNISHFYRVFRKHYGCTPKEFLSAKN